MLYTLLLLVMLRLIIKIECRPPRFLCDLIDSFPRTECVTTTHVRLVYSFFKKKIPAMSRYCKVQSGAWNIFVCVLSIYFALMQKPPARKLIPPPIYIDLFHLSLTVSINKRAPIFCIFLLLFCRFEVCLFFSPFRAGFIDQRVFNLKWTSFHSLF